MVPQHNKNNFLCVHSKSTSCIRFSKTTDMVAFEEESGDKRIFLVGEHFISTNERLFSVLQLQIQSNFKLQSRVIKHAIVTLQSNTSSDKICIPSFLTEIHEYTIYPF